LQQLREELLARLWAMHAISPATVAGAAEREGAQRVDVVAATWWRMLCDPDPTARRRAASLIERILWPAFSSPADEWWTTPLGAALSTVRSELVSAPTAGVMSTHRLTTARLVTH
jgi:hypothetical protein